MNTQYVNKKTQPKIKDILFLLGSGVFLSSIILFPGAGLGISALYDMYDKSKRQKELKEWDKFNYARLRFLLRRIQKQKLIEIKEENDVSVVRLTEKGRLRTLKYRLENMAIQKPSSWDGKWRLIMYDITKFKQKQQSAFRRMLRKLSMLSLQKSVYLTPYPCGDEVEFLRDYFNVGNEVIYVVADTIENDEVYKRYFGL